MIREKAFWLLDNFKGGSIKKALDEISFIIGKSDSDESNYLRNKYLKSILSYATLKTDFYRYLQGKESVLEFPIVNKTIIRDNYRRFTSNYNDLSRLKTISTSGSTGVPFTIHLSENKTIRNWADNIYFFQLCGYNIGNPLYYLRIWNEVNKKSKFDFFMRNTIPIDISDMSYKALDKLLNTLLNLPKNSVILAYGSTFEILAGYMAKRSFELISKPKVALSMADPINVEARMFLSNSLECPFYSRYSNAENGFLGHQWRMDSEAYLMNTASYFIEFLKFDSNDPVTDGQPGRVIVTDLFNYSIPLIRYDTGDIAIKGKECFNGIEVPIFLSIEGRKLDYIYNTKGDLISPHSIDYAIRSMSKLLQFQIIQKEKKKYELRLIVSEKYSDSEEIARNRLKSYLGSDAIIEVNFVDEIPLLKTGKRKIVINEMIDG